MPGSELKGLKHGGGCNLSGRLGSLGKAAAPDRLSVCAYSNKGICFHCLTALKSTVSLSGRWTACTDEGRETASQLLSQPSGTQVLTQVGHPLVSRQFGAQKRKSSWVSAPSWITSQPDNWTRSTLGNRSEKVGPASYREWSTNLQHTLPSKACVLPGTGCTYSNGSSTLTHSPSPKSHE